MVRRITKKPALKISVFPELPGAVFYGDILDEDIDEATHLQRIRAGYETDLCQVTLHHELGRIGWGYDEIMGAVLNPATLTDCVYLSDWRDVSLLPALIAA